MSNDLHEKPWYPILALILKLDGHSFSKMDIPQQMAMGKLGFMFVKLCTEDVMH